MNFKYIGVGCCFFIILVAFMFSDLWYPGFSKRQTADILLSGGKFSNSAYRKALWHGPSILNEIEAGSEGFTNFNYRSARTIAQLISEMEPLSDIQTKGEQLSNQLNEYQKLFGMLILAKNKALPVNDNEMDFLQSIIVRGKEAKNELKLSDYYSELAMLILGFSEYSSAEDILLGELQRNNVPYSKHEAACTAISHLKNSNHIKESMLALFLNKDFYALAPALKVLKAYLKDNEIEDLIEKRLNMNLEGEREVLEMLRTT